jgi:hypothetical protein
MHVPAPVGGIRPSVYLKNWRGGETLPTIGNPIDIRWISDDDKGTINVDILLSTDGGQTYDFIIASATPDDGQYTWFVSLNSCNQGVRIRVVARDADGNTGSDSSASNLFMTNTAYPPGDCNCSCHRDVQDIPAFITALLDPTHFSNFYPGCPLTPSDFNADGTVNGKDIVLFVDALTP